MKTPFTMLALLATWPANAALAGETCAVPSEKRQSFQALAQLAADFFDIRLVLAARGHDMLLKMITQL